MCRRSVTLCATALFVCLGPSDGTAQAVTNEEVARVVAELGEPLYGRSRAEWKTASPSAKWRDRRGPRDYPPSSVRPVHRGLWCSEATDVTNGVVREAVFYGLRTELPYDCRLEQVRYVVTGSSDVKAAYAALTAVFERQFSGNGVDNVTSVRRAELAIDSESTRSTAYSSDSWEDLRYWFAPTSFVFLFRSGSSVQALAQSYVLDRTLHLETSGGVALRRALDEPIDLDGGASSAQRYGVDLLRWEIVNALRSSDPEAVEAMLSVEGVPDQAVVRRSALRLLKRRGQARDDEHSMLSIAASFVLRRVAIIHDDAAAAQSEIAEFVPFGVNVGCHCQSCRVTHHFIAAVARERPATWWGQLAAYHIVASGGDDCESGKQYKYVISEATKWLKANPRSKLAIPMMLLLAQAYETWWSLGLAPDDEEFVTRSEHAEGGNNARLEAIRWYERIIREAPTSVEAVHARRVLIQIIAGVDTGERRFFQVYA